MSALDQAFLKAYAKETATVGRGATPSRDAPPVADAPVADRSAASPVDDQNAEPRRTAPREAPAAADDAPRTDSSAQRQVRMDGAARRGPAGTSGPHLRFPAIAKEVPDIPAAPASAAVHAEPGDEGQDATASSPAGDVARATDQAAQPAQPSEATSARDEAIGPHAPDTYFTRAEAQQDMANRLAPETVIGHFAGSIELCDTTLVAGPAVEISAAFSESPWLPPVVDEPSHAAAIESEQVETPPAVDDAERTDEATGDAPAVLALPLTPVWEVDRFQWPQVCRQMESWDAEYFHDTGTKLAAASREGLRVLGITSSVRGEGRTMLTLCLARSAAAAGARVAVLDADLANPQLALQLQLELPCGWQDAVFGDLDLTEVAVMSLEDRVALLPLAAPIAGLSDQHAGEARQLVREAARHFDLVLVDMEPIHDSRHWLMADGGALDAAIVLHNPQCTRKAELAATCQHLRDGGVDAVGIAENFVPREQFAKPSVRKSA